MTDKQDVIVSLLKEIDKNVESLGVGGGNTTTSISGGYPIKVVDVSEIDYWAANPNVFYKIKHDGIVPLMVASEAEYYNQSGDFAVFTAETTDDSSESVSQMLMCGGVLVEDTSLEGYSYKIMLYIDGLLILVYFSANPNENSTCTVYVPNILHNGKIIIPSFTTELHNITRINNQGFIYSINVMGVSINTWFIQVEGVVEGKYTYLPTNLLLMDMVGVVSTDVPIEEATKVYLQDEAVELPITKIPSYKDVTETCEYIFEINTPCLLISLYPLYWNNDSMPDLTLQGVLTISIIGGHACYTFKPNT